jgi:uncharacterized protein YggT (Ycf19 family)
MALFLVILQTVILIAALALFAQLIVGAFNWNRRHQNPVYQLLGIVARPFVWLVRRITPRFVLDQHIPVATFLLLGFAYLAVTLVLRDVCLSDLTQAGCERLAASRAGGAN